MGSWRARVFKISGCLPGQRPPVAALQRWQTTRQFSIACAPPSATGAICTPVNRSLGVAGARHSLHQGCAIRARSTMAHQAAP